MSLKDSIVIGIEIGLLLVLQVQKIIYLIGKM